MRIAVLLLAASACGFEVGSPAGTGDDTDAAPTGCVAANWRDEHWSARYPLVIQKARVRGTPGELAVLVAITSAELKQATASGDDIVFTAGDGTTLLPYEIERFDMATGALLAWVRVPGVTNAADTPLYLYFANPAPPAPVRGDVWPDYLAVWHFREDPGGAVGQARDSSTHDRHMTVQNMTSADQVAGKIGGAFGFDGVDNGLVLTPFVFPNRFTYEAWIRPTTLMNYHAVFDVAANNRWFGLAGNKLDFWNGSDHVFEAPITGNTWHAIAAAYDGITLRVYLDGTELPGPQAMSLPAGTSPLQIGFSKTGELFLGSIDEARMHGAPLSADVIGTSYANQAMPDQFVRIDPLERCR
jgi:hypothetical protein